MACLLTTGNIQTKVCQKLSNMVNAVRITKSIIVFRLFNFFSNSPKMKNSSVFPHFMKNSFKTMKDISYIKICLKVPSILFRYS